MKRLIFITLTLLTLAILSACGSPTGPSLDVEQVTKPHPLSNYARITRVHITNTGEDTVTVKEVIANRGNCDLTFQDELPMELDFGEKDSVLVDTGCNLVEVEVITDQGSAIYTW
ncbi:hypothetical protein LL252_00800 [Alcanivorax marinus]|uniref:Lipoprotein n=1 Tax=Alloalcanivorax marinus TaxID=1177169 RepID=A0A9Q3YKT2_9GAMM|nr:hypothetical protein [Alloalcanivorax marinus]MCC4307094.1 hypothetical protein [Alloalcanivorax marinus]|tara:strand:+ start:991 stop:1335 length:345 start_codon:yes stop_codon:yes gene_type:complete